ncbi:dynein light chain roadblock-type 1 [Drosophila elegans]|uniref:dynein light chain roadblock-type 1 n=1 Tax=Drosophila elegans TaxID=30023 RepID=UPI0007E84A50|nr:dynein light chain roadblock-type 1 [Drosophila elegans]
MNRILEQVIHQNGAIVDRILSEHTIGYVVSDNMANAVAETSFDNTSAQAIVKHLNGLLVSTCQSVVRDIDPANKLCFMRLATRKFEYLVAPEEYFTITVVQ